MQKYVHYYNRKNNTHYSLLLYLHHNIASDPSINNERKSTNPFMPSNGHYFMINHTIDITICNNNNTYNDLYIIISIPLYSYTQSRNNGIYNELFYDICIITLRAILQ